MGNFLVGFVLPMLLLAAALMNWSLICLVDLILFLVFQFNASKFGFLYNRQSLLLWSTVIYSIVVILSQSVLLILWAINGENWNITDIWWIKLLGFMIVHSWRSPSVVYFLVLQVSAVLVALIELNWNRFGLVQWEDSFWSSFLSIVGHIGTRMRNACCLLLPAVQLVVGISQPSWISLPFFIGSCVGLVDWSLTSNFLGLFRWWKALQLYAGFYIFLLYVYQLPTEFLDISRWVADFIGVYQVSASSEWTKICSGTSLLLFFVMISCVKCNLEEMEFILSSSESHLTEQLLPSKYSFFIRESRSGVRHTNMLLRRSIFRAFSINFFTYGFPVSLLALSFWSFHFSSIFAFGLLAYVGYIVYAFPSLFRLHRLNGLLLVFILLWAGGTYVFNVAFSSLKGKLGKDMEVWEMVGLWHYPIPGFFLLAQFCLGVLVALGNLVSNSVFLCLSDDYGQSTEDNAYKEVEKDTKVLAVATIAWGLRKCSRAIILALIFLISMKPGFIRAVYMIFFLVYLLSHNIGRRTRQCLILLCEIHFALLYVLRIDLILKAIEKTGSSSVEILSQLGLLQYDGWDFFEIAFLACFCAIHNHGFNMLFSFSAVVQHSPCPPIGFGILKAGLNKSVLLSVYASRNGRSQERSSSERRIALFLSSIGQKFLAMYRSCGTPIAFLTILLTLYLMKPNYVSFGYIFLLLIWIIGRQLVEESKRRLWFPLKAYAVGVFIFIYSLSTFSSFKMWLSRSFDIDFYLGYNPEASFLENVGESLAVMIVMQLYSYERRQSKYIRIDDTTFSESGLLGFIKRLLIWHSNKILYIAVFYASLSPVSLFGFLYLLGLVACSTLRKASRLPSKLFLIYTGVLVMVEYLFQMWGMQAGMFPGQKHFDIAEFLGFQLFKPGFWGLEVGLRGKVLVISACTLQYNVFRWMEKLPTYISRKEKWEEPCPLFVSAEDAGTDFYIPNGESEGSPDAGTDSGNWGIRINSSPSSASGNIQTSNNVLKTGGTEGSSTRKYSLRYIWGSSQQSHKWDKRKIHSLRNERFETQKSIVKVYLKFWVENMFNLFSLEINMIALLLASFALLNAISILYIALLAACILLSRRVIRKLWPLFVFLFASILIIEYFAIWKDTISPNQATPDDADVHCHDCSRNSKSNLHYCEKCWLGIIIDDSRVLINYFIVFILACFKLRADRLSSFSGSYTYRQVMSQQKNIFVWRDLSFETKSMWTILDYLRLYCFCHLLDLVLALILITGTLEYDILHLGYLAFALVFFRMRLEILKKRNRVFKFLRMYNFAVIVLSLAYQSPFIGDFSSSKSATMNYIFEVIGFHKYDYGFQITARSALVEIIIFILISLQSYMFSSPEFDYVSRYLEAEQIGALVREQEKRAAWKTAQLQHIRESVDKKRQRNMQVEKMKSEVLNLQVQLDNGHSAANCTDSTSESKGLVERAMVAPDRSSWTSERVEQNFRSEDHVPREPSAGFESCGSPVSIISDSPYAAESIQHSLEHSSCEIMEVEEHPPNCLIDDLNKKDKGQAENPLISAVQLIGDGVSQVQSIGNQAVNNLVSFLNIKPDDSDLNERVSFEDGKYDQMEIQKRHLSLNRSSSVQSDKSTEAASLQLGRICHHIWSQMQANIDVVCYCCFVLVYLWNFSLLSMVYLAALFLYALCVNTGPSYIFWVTMLIYTEIYILLQYLYQIIIQHHGWTWSATSNLIFELGFPEHRIASSFVIGAMPLFLVYLFTLIQSSITAKDGEWMCTSELSCSGRSIRFRKEIVSNSWSQRAKELQCQSLNLLKRTIRGFIWFLKSVIQGAESPPYFVQVSMDVSLWPDGGIQPERIESAMNQLLQIMHNQRCTNRTAILCPYASKVHVQSIERSLENPNVAVAVFEVIYASPLSGCGSAEWYKSLTPAVDIAKEILNAQESGIAGQIRFPYSILSVIGGGKREIDLYAYVFGADLTVFFLVAIFYQSVMKNKSEFLDVSQLEDQFPKDFVFMLMGIFFLIVVDRIIYLCSFAVGKVVFYVFNLILYTYYITKYAWRPSQQEAGVLALRAIYLAKAVSLALQAIQIRYGIPHQTTLYRQFLTSEVSRINYLGYRLYRALPFLYELRCVLDWSCTTTSLTMYDWLKLEDINASLYLVKCDAVLNRAKHKQGDKQTTTTKCCNGICLFFVLICVIWAPMLMYSSGNPTNIANPIKDASVQIDIRTAAGKLTLYETTLCEKLQWDSLDNEVNLDPEHYLDAFDKNDIQLVCCQADASSLWLVPEVVKSRFIQSLEWGTDMDMSFTWVLSRERPKGKEVVRYIRPVDTDDLPGQLDVKMVLNGSSNSFRINNVCPRYLRVTSSGEVRPLELEVNTVSADLVMNRAEFQWWSFHDVNTSIVSGCGGLTGPMAIIVSEETPPQGILGDTLSKFSIWGLYITFVLAVGRFIRLQCADLRMRIPYENLPSCDRLIAMCENIYSARAEGELGVEEVLYWTLVKIYRSPHMLLEYTKVD